MFDDIVHALASTLGTSDATAGLMMAFLVILGIGLVLATLKMDMIPSAFVLVISAGVLTAVGWMPLGLFIVGIIVIVALFILMVIRGGSV